MSSMSLCSIFGESVKVSINNYLSQVYNSYNEPFYYLPFLFLIFFNMALQISDFDFSTTVENIILLTTSILAPLIQTSIKLPNQLDGGLFLLCVQIKSPQCILEISYTFMCHLHLYKAGKNTRRIYTQLSCHSSSCVFLSHYSLVFPSLSVPQRGGAGGGLPESIRPFASEISNITSSTHPLQPSLLLNS